MTVTDHARTKNRIVRPSASRGGEPVPDRIALSGRPSLSWRLRH